MSDQRIFSSALLDPTLPCPDGFRTWNGSDPARRFAVYRNNVCTSLVDALADTFPVVQALVGEEFFRAMALLYVRSSPPTSPVLAFYGQHFPEFVESFEPAAGLPYLSDLARLETIRVRAYHSADASPVSHAELTAVMAQPELVHSRRLRFLPSVEWLRSRYPVATLWAAHQQPEVDLSDIDLGEPQDVLVLRSVHEVLVLVLSPGLADFMQLLQAGLSLGEAAQQASDHHAEFDLSQALQFLLHWQAIAKFD